MTIQQQHREKKLTWNKVSLVFRVFRFDACAKANQVNRFSFCGSKIHSIWWFGINLIFVICWFYSSVRFHLDSLFVPVSVDSLLEKVLVRRPMCTQAWHRLQIFVFFVPRSFLCHFYPSSSEDSMRANFSLFIICWLCDFRWQTFA